MSSEKPVIVFFKKNKIKEKDMKKVFCTECDYFDGFLRYSSGNIEKDARCNCPTNKGDNSFKKDGIYIKTPEQKNVKNDCDDFCNKKKEQEKLKYFIDERIFKIKEETFQYSNYISVITFIILAIFIVISISTK